jgi:hypothetical protein
MELAYEGVTSGRAFATLDIELVADAVEVG